MNTVQRLLMASTYSSATRREHIQLDSLECGWVGIFSFAVFGYLDRGRTIRMQKICEKKYIPELCSQLHGFGGIGRHYAQMCNPHHSMTLRNGCGWVGMGWDVFYAVTVVWGREEDKTDEDFVNKWTFLDYVCAFGWVGWNDRDSGSNVKPLPEHDSAT